MDLVLTLLTVGLFNIYVQYRQMKAVNVLVKEQRYSFLRWAFFTLITFGLYHVYHEYRMSQDLATRGYRGGLSEPWLAVLLTLTGFHIVLDAIQQSQINSYFGEFGL